MAKPTAFQQIRGLKPNFWYSNWMEAQERLAFFGSRAILPLYMVYAVAEGGLGLSYSEKGTIYSIWAVVQCLVPMISGGFTDQYSPVAEIFSFHGLSECTDGAYPYLHSMGPRDQHITAQHGWSLGNVFAIIGSTDHHNAFPGCYGYGRLAVWAQELTRDAIWEAIAQRRTYALTGDRITLRFQVNDRVLGQICPPSAERRLDVSVEGGDAIDYIDVLHNNQIIHRECVFPGGHPSGPYIVHIEMGWGEKSDAVAWDVEMEVIAGELQQVEPRFRGFGPTESPPDDGFTYTQWERSAPNKVKIKTRTRQNLSLHTPSTEGAALFIHGDMNTRLRLVVNGSLIDQPLSELMDGARSHYLGGFLSPAVYFHRAVPRSEYSRSFSLTHHSEFTARDWYYIRVRQRNNQWAWSSPIWVDKMDQDKTV